MKMTETETSTQTSRHLERLPATEARPSRAHSAPRHGLAALSVLVLGGCSAPNVSETSAALDQTILGTAQNFAVLGGSTVTNTGSTVVYGDLGVHPGLAISGFPPGLVTGGTIHAGDGATLQAQSDLTAAYVTLASDAPTQDLTGQDLGGLTLTPGVYRFSSSAQLTGTLTLDALGDPGAIFVFQIGSTLTTASNSSVVVLNNAGDCNIFWQVGISATLGTTTAFKGNILALTSITLNTGATVSGRILARNAAVTMDDNDVSILRCESPGAHPILCGDGLLEAPELCDDGNLVAGDGCDATCNPEHFILCGDGLLEAPELCDDGNLVAGDGCDASCNSEHVVVCGDGLVEAPEVCDDGNVLSGDGCDYHCLCVSPAPPLCGNGIMEAGEACDDGNLAGQDGCTAQCEIEQLCCCGNGAVEPGETCDDGNSVDGDGCSMGCRLE